MLSIPIPNISVGGCIGMHSPCCHMPIVTTVHVVHYTRNAECCVVCETAVVEIFHLDALEFTLAVDAHAVFENVW